MVLKSLSIRLTPQGGGSKAAEDVPISPKYGYVGAVEASSSNTTEKMRDGAMEPNDINPV